MTRGEEDSNGRVLDNWGVNVQVINSVSLSETLANKAGFVLEDVAQLVSFDVKDPFESHESRLRWHVVFVDNFPSVEGLNGVEFFFHSSFPEFRLRTRKCFLVRSRDGNGCR